MPCSAAVVGPRRGGERCVRAAVPVGAGVKVTVAAGSGGDAPGSRWLPAAPSAWANRRPPASRCPPPSVERRCGSPVPGRAARGALRRAARLLPTPPRPPRALVLAAGAALDGGRTFPVAPEGGTGLMVPRALPESGSMRGGFGGGTTATVASWPLLVVRELSGEPGFDPPPLL